MGTEGPIVTGEVNGWSITTNSGDKESIAALGKKDEAKPEGEEKPDVSKAASDLGKLGGKAAAEKRAAEAKAAEKAEKVEKQEAKPEGEPEVEAKAEPEGEEDKGKEKPLGKPRDDPRARMLEATRKESEAKKALAAERVERERDRAELQRLRSEFESLKRGEKPEDKPKARIFDPSKPEPEDFADWPDYEAAHDEWLLRKWEDGHRKRAAASQEEQRFSEQAASFVSKIKEVVPDFQERIAPEILELRPHFSLEPGQFPTGENFIASELFYSPETAPALMLHLTEHPDEFQRIATLSTPREVSRALAKIETRLEAATAGNGSERKEVSKAAPPVKPVSGAPYVAESDEYKPGMSFDEYARLRQKKTKAQR